MEIKNINTKMDKNLQLISTYGENMVHRWVDLLEFKYEVDGNLYSVRDIFIKIFQLEEDNKNMRESIKNALSSIDNITTLTTTSIDLLDVRTLKIQKDLDELKNKLRIIIE